MPISRPKVRRGKAIEIAPRLIRSDCSRLGSASPVRDENALTPWLEVLLRHLAGQQPHLDLPLDVQATAFQGRVWEELRKIPLGQTRTYGEVAAALLRCCEAPILREVPAKSESRTT